MYGDQSREFVCGYWGLKGQGESVTSVISVTIELRRRWRNTQTTTPKALVVNGAPHIIGHQFRKLTDEVSVDHGQHVLVVCTAGAATLVAEQTNQDMTVSATKGTSM